MILLWLYWDGKYKQCKYIPSLVSLPDKYALYSLYIYGNIYETHISNWYTIYDVFFKFVTCK